MISQSAGGTEEQVRMDVTCQGRRCRAREEKGRDAGLHSQKDVAAACSLRKESKGRPVLGVRGGVA